MKFLFEATVMISDRQVGYRVFLLSNGSYYAESMNPIFDNFMLKKVNDEWATSLIRNQQSARQLGDIINRNFLN